MSVFQVILHEHATHIYFRLSLIGLWIMFFACLPSYWLHKCLWYNSKRNVRQILPQGVVKSYFSLFLLRCYFTFTPSSAITQIFHIINSEWAHEQVKSYFSTCEEIFLLKTLHSLIDISLTSSRIESRLSTRSTHTSLTVKNFLILWINL